MNFIAATVELRSHSSDTVNAYGLEYCGAHACVPSGGGNSEVRLRVLCYNREGPKLDRFRGWKEGEEGMQHTSREMFVIPLIKAVQELSTEVKELKAKLEDK